MPTLHIEHAISDFATWSAAYGRFAERRRQAGVLHERVCTPVDDAAYVVVDLDFATVDQAQSFRRFLVNEVWAKAENSPALTGEPRARVLQVMHER